MITDDQCREIIEAGTTKKHNYGRWIVWRDMADNHAIELAEEVLALRLKVWDLEMELHGPTYGELKAGKGRIGPIVGAKNIEIMGHHIEWWKGLEAENERLRKVIDRLSLKPFDGSYIGEPEAYQEYADSIADQAEPEVCLTLMARGRKPTDLRGLDPDWEPPVEEVK